MKFEFDNALKVIHLGLKKSEIEHRVKEFVKDTKLKVKVSKHNILIQKKEFDPILKTSHAALFTFDDEGILVAARLSDIDALGFMGLRVPRRRLALTHEKIMNVFQKGENYSCTSRCPVLNKVIDFKQKECDVTYYKNCYECEHRSQQRAYAEYKDYHCLIDYNADSQKELSIVNLDYGYSAYNKFWFINEYGDTELE